MRALCQLDDFGFCFQCGEPSDPSIKKSCPAFIAANPRPHRLGWGDRLSELFKRFGFKDDGCGPCGRRKAAINQVGWTISNVVLRILSHLPFDTYPRRHRLALKNKRRRDTNPTEREIAWRAKKAERLRKAIDAKNKKNTPPDPPEASPDHSSGSVDPPLS